jgi:hypothetical protein
MCRQLALVSEPSGLDLVDQSLRAASPKVAQGKTAAAAAAAAASWDDALEEWWVAAWATSAVGPAPSKAGPFAAPTGTRPRSADAKGGRGAGGGTGITRAAQNGGGGAGMSAWALVSEVKRWAKQAGEPAHVDASETSLRSILR